MTVIVNKKIKPCQSCDQTVAVGKGFAYVHGNRWLTCCNSTACIKQLGLKIPGKVLGQKERRELLLDGSLFCPYEPGANDLLKSLPKHETKPKWDGTNMCRWVSLADKNLPRVIDICKRCNINYPKELEDRIASNIDVKAAKERANKKGLYDFQRPGVEFLAIRNKAILAYDMGLGKTITSLCALENDSSVLVIGPKSVKINWEKETKKWRPDIKPKVLAGIDTLEIPGKNEMVIVNPNILPDHLENIETIPKRIKDKLKNVTLIVDEASMYKNYKAKRTVKVTNLCRLVKNVWFLTGTPLDNKPQDLYGVLSTGNMVGETFGSFRTFLRCFNAIQLKWGGYEFTGPPNPDVPERLKNVMLRLTKEETGLDLPPLRFQDIYVNGYTGELEKELDEAYNEFKYYFENESLPAFKDFSRILAKIAESRIPSMLEIVEEYESTNTPLLVFSTHRAPIDILKERKDWGVITGDTSIKKRDQVIEDFQSGKLAGVGLTIQAGGLGITLTRANDILFVDRDFRPGMNLQAIDRARRIGSTGERILVKTMMSNHPLDIHINKLLNKKTNIILKAIDESVKVKLMKPAPVSSVDLKEETEEELAARINSIIKETEKKEAKERVHSILDRERQRALKVSDSFPEPELTDSRKELIREAINYLADRCDYATTRDGQGFNRPDAYIGHWLAATGLENDDEISLRVAERICSRYYRQLHEAGYAKIWKP